MIACQTASGVWFLIGYQTYFYTVSGIAKAFEYSVMNTCFGFLGVNIGMYAIREWLGRRAILMLGAIACGLCQLASAIASSVNPNSFQTGQILVSFTALFFFFYNGCVGAASYPVATELVSSRLRAWTVGTATSLGYLLAWLVNFCTPYFINPEHLNWVSLMILTNCVSYFLYLRFGADLEFCYRVLNMDIFGPYPIFSAWYSSTSSCRR